MQCGASAAGGRSTVLRSLVDEVSALRADVAAQRSQVCALACVRVCVCMRVRVCACVRACASMRVRVRACAHLRVCSRVRPSVCACDCI